jgi:class 3 adenylate cyclase
MKTGPAEEDAHEPRLIGIRGFAGLSRQTGGVTLGGGVEDEGNPLVRTFLIADIRGYTRFTEQHGDEASAKLAARFSEIVRDGVQVRGGELIEIRGDEALAVFDSARQAIRAAVDLQSQFAEETDMVSNCPIRVGIGIDSGEAIKLEDGSFRGAALNIAARLCGLAQSGEIIVSEGTSHLAGRVPGLRYLDRGRAHLKGIADTVRLIRVAPEGEQQSQPWILMIFGKPGRIGWRVGLGVVLIAAATAAAVVYLTTGSDGGTSAGAARQPTGTGTSASATTHVAPASDVIALVPAGLQKGACGRRSPTSARSRRPCASRRRVRRGSDPTGGRSRSTRAATLYERPTSPCERATSWGATAASATRSAGAARAPGRTGPASRVDGACATSRETTPSSSGYTSAWARRTTATSSASREKAAATTCA